MQTARARTGKFVGLCPCMKLGGPVDLKSLSQAGKYRRGFGSGLTQGPVHFSRGNTIFTDSPLRPGNSVNNAFSSVGITELMLPELPLLATVPS